MKRKKNDYTPYPGFYDLRIFDLTAKDFFRLGGYRNFFTGLPGEKLLQNLCPKAMGRTERAWSIAANVLTAQTETK